MPRVTISLTEEQKAFIDAQVKARGLDSASLFVEQLVVREWLKAQGDRIERLLLEGLNSGPATPMTKQDWDDIRREVLIRT